jgi:hypothetical protein
MSTTWTLTAGEICRDALEHLNVVGSGETVSADDQNVALRALDAVLKELPLVGYHWPKLSGEASLTWVLADPDVITLPADFFNYPLVWKTVSGELIPLIQIPHSEWIAKTDKTQTAEQVTHFYVDPAKVLHFWPIPTADPVAKIQYQKIVDDASATVTPDVLQTMKNALGYGVANELTLKFGIDQAKRVEINARWREKLEMALQSAISYEPICISVAD